MGEHFRELRHRKVLCIADNAICMDLKRYQGFCHGFGEEVPLWQIPMQKMRRRKFYEEHLEELTGYTGVFAVSDYYAVDLMQFLTGRGIRVPQDISVAGFDDTPICEQVTPRLTSISQDGERRASTAMELLLRMKEDPRYSQNLLLPVSLIARESMAKCTDFSAE